MCYELQEITSEAFTVVTDWIFSVNYLHAKPTVVMQILLQDYFIAAQYRTLVVVCIFIWIIYNFQSRENWKVVKLIFSYFLKTLRPSCTTFEYWQLNIYKFSSIFLFMPWIESTISMTINGKTKHTINL